MGTYHSYTFSVRRPQDNGLMENLLVNLQEDGSYKLYLVSYDLTSEEHSDLLQGMEVDFENKYVVIEIENDGLTNNLFGRFAPVDCTTAYTTYCTQGNHANGYLEGNPCPAYGVRIEITCTEGGGDGGHGQGQGTSSGSPHNGTTTPTPNPIVSTPVVLTMAQQLSEFLTLNDQQVIWANKQDQTTIDKITSFMLTNCEQGNNSEDCTQAEEFVLQAIEAGVNGTLVTAFPLIKYPENSNYETLYPKLTNVLKNDLPKIAQNQIVIDVINEITDAPKETIKEALQWGKGPTIQIQQLGGEGDAEKYGSYRGHLSDDYLDTLFLDIDLVNEFEDSNITEISDALSFLIAVTILHEYVHLGDMVFGDNFWGDLFFNEDYDPENEAGIIFEMNIFGEAVWRENAGIILRKIGGF